MRFWWLVAIALSVTACAARNDDREEARTAAGHSQPATASAAASSGSAKAPAAGRARIAVLGDSLTAGLGIAKSASYPALLQARLDAAGVALANLETGG